MKVLVVLAHPDAGSLNHAIAGVAVTALGENGHEVLYHDLYAEKFDPLLPVPELCREAPLDPVLERHCRELAEAGGIVVVHPNWWGQPPAILKGWIDRTFRAGVAYRFAEDDCGDGVPAGLLPARAALVFNTSNTPARREDEVFGDPLETLWRNCIFGLCGVQEFGRVMYRPVCTSTPDQRAAWLADVAARTARCFPRD
jgi:NAD(P)H dehydrogenase (quinone)